MASAEQYVSLELTGTEAAALRALLGSISWEAQPAALSVAFEDIFSALYDAGVEDSGFCVVVKEDSL